MKRLVTGLTVSIVIAIVVGVVNVLLPASIMQAVVDTMMLVSLAMLTLAIVVIVDAVRVDSERLARIGASMMAAMFPVMIGTVLAKLAGNPSIALASIPAGILLATVMLEASEE